MTAEVHCYLRVSKGSQSVEAQRADVAALAERVAPGKVPAWHEEVESAGKVRPVLDALCKSMKSGDTLVLFALDRMERSMQGAIFRILDLDQRGVRIVTVCEPWMDSAGPTRSLLVALFSWVAEQERRRIGERTRAGLDRVRREGSKSGQPIGRPKAPEALFAEIRDLVSSGLTVADACTQVRYDLPSGKRTTIHPATYRKWLARQKAALIARATSTETPTTDAQ